jgi:aspartate carbamoyltransferase catalytic subunit
MELPAHVDRRLREEFRCQVVSASKGKGGDASIDALYVTPEEPHQQSLFAGPEIELDLGVVDKKVDAVYVTRFQKERWVDKDQPYPKIDRKFLNEPKYSEASVLHPLPRVGELDASVDSDRRAVYFEQAAYGVPVRMALITLLLGLHAKSLHKFEGGFEKKKYPSYDQPRDVGMHCTNANCIVHDPMEAQYVRNKFYIVKTDAPGGCKLRCVYCESDTDRFIVASKKNKWYTDDPTPLLRTTEQHLKDLIVFAEQTEALAAGFHFRRNFTASKSREGTRSHS